jgi:hypothetical protein
MGKGSSGGSFATDCKIPSSFGCPTRVVVRSACLIIFYHRLLLRGVKTMKRKCKVVSDGDLAVLL